MSTATGRGRMADYDAAMDTLEPDCTEITQVQYEPWLLGFCRWEITLCLRTDNVSRLCETLAAGRWRWRGRGAPYVETVW